MNVSHSPAQSQYSSINSQQVLRAVTSSQTPRFGAMPWKSIATGSAAVVIPAITKSVASIFSVEAGSAAKAETLVDNIPKHLSGTCSYRGQLLDYLSYALPGDATSNKIWAGLDGLATTVALPFFFMYGKMHNPSRVFHSKLERTAYYTPLTLALKFFVGSKAKAAHSSISSALEPTAETFVKNIEKANAFSPLMCDGVNKAKDFNLYPSLYMRPGNILANGLTTGVDILMSIPSFGLMFLAGKLWKRHVLPETASIHLVDV